MNKRTPVEEVISKNDNEIMPTKPTHIEYNFDAIPQDFKNHDNWLVWNYEYRKGKWAKPPRTLDGKRAIDQDSSKHSFHEIIKYFDQDNIDGIGFSIKSCGLVCIDIDHWSEWAEEDKQLLKELKDYGYTEISPSGDGYHLWLKVTKPKGMKCKSDSFFNGNVEVYDADRYITMTGHQADEGFDCFGDCQEEFEKVFEPLMNNEHPRGDSTATNGNQLSVDEVKSLILNSAGNDRAKEALTTGVPKDSDHSSFDMSLCNALAWATGKNAKLMNEIFISSPLMRDKWNSRRGSSTYGKETIKKAIADTNNVYEGCVSQFDVELSDEQFERLEQIEANKPKHKDDDLIAICSKTPIAQFAAELAKAAQMPRNTTFLTVLSIFSSVTCRVGRVAYPEGSSVQPLGIYFVGEQPPAGGKSRALESSQRAVMEQTDKKRENLTEQIGKSKNDESKTIAQDEKNALFSFITDATPEALDANLSNSSGYFAIASAEQAAINSLLGINYAQDGKGSNNDLLLKGYNGEWHNSLRVGRTGYIGQVVGAVTAITQNGVIDNMLKVSNGTGAIERFIIWRELSLLGLRDHMNQYQINPFIEEEYNSVITSLSRKGIKPFNSLPVLRIEADDWHKIFTLRQQLEPTIGIDGVNSSSLLRGVIGKLDISVMKIAANLHLSTGSNEAFIEHARVDEALLIFKAYLKHLKNLISSSAINAVSPREESMLAMMGRNAFAMTDLKAKLGQRKLFKIGEKKKLANVTDTVEALLEKGVLEMIKIHGKEKYKAK